MRQLIILYLPWLLSVCTITQQFFLGKKDIRGWLVALLGQVGWSVWVLAAQHWGLLPLNLALWYLYIRNYRLWKAEETAAFIAKPWNSSKNEKSG